MADNDGVYHLRIKQRATFSRTATYKQNGLPRALTGYTIKAEIRTDYADALPLVTMTATIDDAAGGVFTFGLSADQTAALATTGTAPGKHLNYFYDVLLIKDAIVERVLQGFVYVSAGVTHAT